MTYFVYVTFSLINVIISTLKSIITVKGNKISAATINAISYSVNTIVIIYTAGDFPLLIKLLISASTNFIGVYVGIAILQKLKKKNKLWELVVTIKISDVEKFEDRLMQINNIIFNSIRSRNNIYEIYFIYTHNNEESTKVKKVLQDFHVYTMVHEESVKL